MYLFSFSEMVCPFLSLQNFYLPALDPLLFVHIKIYNYYLHCYTNTDDNDINYVTDVHKKSRYTVIYYLSKCTEAVDWGATNLFSFISFFYKSINYIKENKQRRVNVRMQRQQRIEMDKGIGVLYISKSEILFLWWAWEGDIIDSLGIVGAHRLESMASSSWAW